MNDYVEGYFAYCPQPTDFDQYTYCCLYYHLGVDRPSCCRFPFHTGVVIALFLSSVVAFLVLLFLMCWFCPICPLAKKLRERKEDEAENSGEMDE
ncbi:hypothetical protein niasHT_022378 [Heterodera trifolii]|uniref:Uncharacterized protein n=1 Tax=Heterodera trifolii TaxID=157864 RepID=A0ABD2IHT6_9BILA